MRVLVAVMSKHGSTWEVARAIGDAMAAPHIRVDVKHMDEVADVTKYDAFILGSAVYAGHWLREALAFVHTYASELHDRPVWLFSSGPIGLSPKPSGARAVDIREVAGLIRIREHRIFAGRLKRDELSFIERALTSAAHSREGDFRDWGEIKTWATHIAQSLVEGQVATRQRRYIH